MFLTLIRLAAMHGGFTCASLPRCLAIYNCLAFCGLVRVIFTARCPHGCVGGLTKNIEIFMKNSGTNVENGGVGTGNVTFRQINQDKANLKAFMNCPALGVAERVAIKQMVNQLDDATLMTQTKIKHTNEIYGEMKGHKKYVEDAEATKTILLETQRILAEAADTEIKMPAITAVNVSELLPSGTYESKDEAKSWKYLFH